jgi:DNA gyrase/topoisomerase IV subunit B
VGDEVDVLDHIRRRPGMYIGGSGPAGLVHLVMEVASNSFDQVLAGAAHRIEVTIGPEGSVEISDDGSGISVEVGDDGRSFLERVFTEMHHGPTADGHLPHVHLGLGGLGVFVVSALSELVDVQTCDGEVTHHQSFARGRVASPLVVLPDAQRGQGTTVRFVPDPEIFGAQRFPVGTLEEQLTTLAALVPGVVMRFSVDQTDGPHADLRHLHQTTWRQEPPLEPFLIEHRGPAGRASMALSFSKRGWQHAVASRSFCNYFELGQRGSEMAGVEEGMRRVFGASMPQALERTKVVLHVVLDDPEFVGPTRAQLDSPEAIGLVADALEAHLPGILMANPDLDADLRHRE